MFRVLLTSTTMFLGGCCCCNPFSWVPDDLMDSAVEEGVKQGVEMATGARVDGDGDRFTLRTPDGELVLARGAAALDPRMPVSPYPNCPIAGGASSVSDGVRTMAFTQTSCQTTMDSMRAHFDQELEQLGATVEPYEAQQGAQTLHGLSAEGDGTRFRSIKILLTEDLDNPDRAGVIATAQIDR